MRIVDRATFLAMPIGTVFAKADAHHSEFAGELSIKGRTVADVDFFYQPLSSISIVDCGEGEVSLGIDRAVQSGRAGAQIPLDFDCQTRDGLFDVDQMFFVFSGANVEALIARLQMALEGRE